MNPKIELVIFGCGGHARSVVDILLFNKPDVSTCFIDESANEDEFIYSFPVIKKWLGLDTHKFIAIGDNYKRSKMLSLVGEKFLVNIISKTSYIGYESIVMQGVFIGNFCHIGPFAVIGKNTIINTGSVVEHEVKIGSHSHVGPNATISGRSVIGDYVFIGAGATIKDYVSVCSNVTIGAGATVVNNITEPGVYVGCPARIIK